MDGPSSWRELVFWRDGQRRCELWMLSGAPELRIYLGEVLSYKERAPLDALHQRAEQLRQSHPR